MQPLIVHPAAPIGEGAQARPRSEGPAHTPGPWKVYEFRYPYAGRTVGNLNFPAGEHVEYRIGTEWRHPQLQGPVPVVVVSIGIGDEQTKAHYLLSTSKADADLIAAAPDLYAACAAMLAWDDAEKGAKPFVDDNGAGFYARIALCDEAFAKARAALAKAGAA